MLYPTVGTMLLDWTSGGLSWFKMVVFPLLSNPRIRMFACLFEPLRRFEKAWNRPMKSPLVNDGSISLKLPSRPSGKTRCLHSNRNPTLNYLYPVALHLILSYSLYDEHDNSLVLTEQQFGCSLKVIIILVEIEFEWVGGWVGIRNKRQTMNNEY